MEIFMWLPQKKSSRALDKKNESMVKTSLMVDQIYACIE